MYSENDYRNYLQHEGILGMKWGNRNGPPYPLSLGKHSAAEKKKMKPSLLKRLKKAKADKKRRKALAKHRDIMSRQNDTSSYGKDKLKDLTDKEMQARIDRIKMEEYYMNNLPVSSSEKGRRIVKDILKKSAIKSAETLATAALTYAGKQAIKKVISEEAYREMFNSGKKDKDKD